jgi:hypothetical protein
MSAITKTRYIPKDSTPVTLEGVPAVVYVYPFGGNYAGIAYARKANTSAWHYQYGNEANALAAANRWLVSMRDVEQMKATNRAAKQAARGEGHPFKVGDIFHWSWGWEQTNCDFYQAVAVSKGTVTLRQIASETHGRDGGSSMSDMRMAVKNHFLSAEEPFVKRPQCQPGANDKTTWHIPMQHGYCSLWDGRPEYCSWYA